VGFPGRLPVPPPYFHYKQFSQVDITHFGLSEDAQTLLDALVPVPLEEEQDEEPVTRPERHIPFPRHGTTFVCAFGVIYCFVGDRGLELWQLLCPPPFLGDFIP